MKKRLAIIAAWFGTLAAALFVHKKGVEKVREEELERRINIMDTDKKKMDRMYSDGFESGIICTIKALRAQEQTDDFIVEMLMKAGFERYEAETFLLKANFA